jgi:thymidylate synthase (FAD)
MSEVQFVDKMSVELINTNASDDMVALAAWVSHANDEKARLENREGVEKLISFLYRNKHMSPFEHGQFICKADVPLRVRSEWHRHRTQSYNEVSTRYTEMTPRFYIPPIERPLVQEGKPGNYYFVAGSVEQYAVAKRTLERNSVDAYENYLRLLEIGVAKEVASYNLPINLMTQFYFTASPRNLMQFLTLRNESHALFEIREAALQVEKIFAETMPLTYKAYIKDRDEQRYPAQTVQIPEYRSGGMIGPSDGQFTINIHQDAVDKELIRDLLERMNKNVSSTQVKQR